MKELTLNDRPVVPDVVISRELDGETVLLNLETGIYFGLDAVGSDMWRAIKVAGVLSDAVDALHAQYDVDPAALGTDLLRLANDMLAKGLLRLPDPRSAP
jgi:hypothetical protein